MSYLTEILNEATKINKEKGVIFSLIDVNNKYSYYETKYMIKNGVDSIQSPEEAKIYAKEKTLEWMYSK